MQNIDLHAHPSEKIISVLKKSHPIMKIYILLRVRSQTSRCQLNFLISNLRLGRVFSEPLLRPQAAPGPFLSPGLSASLLGGCCSAYKC